MNVYLLQHEDLTGTVAEFLFNPTVPPIPLYDYSVNLFFTSLAIVVKASSTFVEFLALVSRKGSLRSFANL